MSSVTSSDERKPLLDDASVDEVKQWKKGGYEEMKNDTDNKSIFMKMGVPADCQIVKVAFFMDDIFEHQMKEQPIFYEYAFERNKGIRVDRGHGMPTRLMDAKSSKEMVRLWMKIENGVLYAGEGMEIGSRKVDQLTPKGSTAIQKPDIFKPECWALKADVEENTIEINGKPFMRISSTEKKRASQPRTDSDYIAQANRRALIDTDNKVGLILNVTGAARLRVGFFPHRLKDGAVPLSATEKDFYEFEFLGPDIAPNRRESLYKNRMSHIASQNTKGSLEGTNPVDLWMCVDMINKTVSSGRGPQFGKKAVGEFRDDKAMRPMDYAIAVEPKTAIVKFNEPIPEEEHSACGGFFVVLTVLCLLVTFFILQKPAPVPLDASAPTVARGLKALTDYFQFQRLV